MPIPVVVGGDIGAYAIIRAFHERYGVTGIVLAQRLTKAFASTRLAQVRVADVENPKKLVKALESLAKERPGEDLILLTNADWYVETIVKSAKTLGKHYKIPMCSPQAFDRISSKEAFHQDCSALGIPVPAGVAVDIAKAKPGDDDALLAPLTFPAFAKPDSSAEYSRIAFAGKQKVYHLPTRNDVDALLATLRKAKYPGTFVFQDFIPGDETQMRTLTAYRNAKGKVTLLVTGRVLLEEHTPGALGIPAAILTQKYDDAMDAMTRYLDRIDYRGFANADYKFDVRTGKHVFFEVNPRVGRNNYYATAAGANIAEHATADVMGTKVTPIRADKEILYSVVPLRLLTRYLTDRKLKRQVVKAARRGIAKPLYSKHDDAPKRRIAITAHTLNHFRKFKRYYPKPTATGF